MISKRNLTLFVSAFAVALLLVLAVPDKGYSGISLGCCISNAECVGCGALDGCAILPSECPDNADFSPEQACFEQFGGCGGPDNVPGCCVISGGQCEDDVQFGSCIEDGAEAWFYEASCSEVPQCVATRNVPTVSEWGLVGLAAILGVIAIIIIRRKKAAA